jgi:hypothetical protein
MIMPPDMEIQADIDFGSADPVAVNSRIETRNFCGATHVHALHVHGVQALSLQLSSRWI